jgi:hypothetical protein
MSRRRNAHHPAFRISDLRFCSLVPTSDTADNCAVAYQITCPNCSKDGLVRAENVINGKSAMRMFYCGRCEHQWSVVDAPPPPARPVTPMSKPRTRVIRHRARHNIASR